MKISHPLVVPAALLWLAACGDSSASSVAGTYTLDAAAMEAEAMNQMPPEMRDNAVAKEQMKKLLANMKGEVRLQSDNTWKASFQMGPVPGMPEAGRSQTAEGTWTLEGTQLTLTSTKENDEPSSEVKTATLKDGQIEISGEGGQKLVLKKS